MTNNCCEKCHAFSHFHKEDFCSHTRCNCHIKATTKESWPNIFLNAGAQLVEADLLAMIPVVKKILASERTALRERIKNISPSKEEGLDVLKNPHAGMTERSKKPFTMGYLQAKRHILALLDSDTN